MLNTSNPRFSVASQLGFRITTSIQPKALDHLSHPPSYRRFYSGKHVERQMSNVVQCITMFTCFIKMGNYAVMTYRNMNLI